MSKRFWRILAGVVWLAGCVLTVIYVPKLKTNTSLAQLFPTQSEARARFADFDQAFGTDDTLLLIVEDSGTPPVFNAGCLDYLDRLVQQLESNAAVDAVMSIANLDDFSVKKTSLFGKDIFTPGGISRYLPADYSSITAADRARYCEDPLLQQGLLSADGSAAAIWVMLDQTLRQSEDYLEQVKGLVGELPAPPSERYRLAATGFPLLHQATLELLWTDGLKLLVGALLAVSAMALAGGVALRSAIVFLLSWLAVVGFLSAWFQWTDRSLHVFSNTLLPLLLVTSGATFVHLGRAQRRPDPGSFRNTLRACFLTTLTTATGFATLTLSTLSPLAALGLEVAVGAFLSLGVLALLLVSLPDPPLIHRVRAVPVQGARRRGLLRAGIVVCSLLSCPWVLLEPERIGVLGDLLEYLPPDHPRIQDARTAEDAIGAQTAFEVVVALDEQDYQTQLSSPEFFLQLKEFEQELMATGEQHISYILSPMTFLAYLNTKLADESSGSVQERFVVTEQSAEFAINWLIGPYLSFFAGKEVDAASNPLLATLKDSMRQLLSTDGNRVRFGCRIKNMSPEAILDLAAKLKTGVFQKYERILGVPSIYATGYSVLVSETAVEVRNSQWRSLLYGGAALSLILLFVLRSVRVWLVAIFTNVLSLLGLLTVLWLAKAQLNLYSTVLTAALLGIIVDDTVHILDTRRRLGSSLRAMVEVGPSVLLSSVCLAFGFGLFFLSALPVYRQFAWSAITGISLALFWDLIALPFLCDRIQKSRDPEQLPEASAPA